MATIVPSEMANSKTTRGRPPGAQTSPAAPLISAGCAAVGYLEDRFGINWVVSIDTA